LQVTLFGMTGWYADPEEDDARSVALDRVPSDGVAGR
jgi:hypothetical protein